MPPIDNIPYEGKYYMGNIQGKQFFNTLLKIYTAIKRW